MKGVLTSAAQDYETGKIILTFMVEDAPNIEEMRGDLSITAKRYSEKRTLSQNAYYWVLLGKVAAKLRTSIPEMHNELLGRYGQPWEIDGQHAFIFLPDDEQTERKVARDSRSHMRPTNRTENGRRVYVLMRGSKTYDTAEMTRLLDGLIEEAKEIGVETIPPMELERIRAHEREQERKQEQEKGEERRT